MISDRKGFASTRSPPDRCEPLAAAGISDFKSMLHHVAERAPLKRNIDAEEVGKTALYLCSDWGSAVTGEVVHVDAGYNIMGM